VIYHSEEVLDTTSEHDSNVNVSLCKGGVDGTGKYNHLIAATNYPCAGVNTICAKSKGQGKMVYNTTSELGLFPYVRKVLWVLRNIKILYLPVITLWES